jgi:hypothetical protein
MRIRYLMIAAMTATAATACADAGNVTGPRPNGPSFDGGWTIGSGGRSDTTSVPATTDEVQGECTSEEIGGWTIGSGGVAPAEDQCEVQ